MNTREFVSYYKRLRQEQDETIEYEEAREEKRVSWSGSGTIRIKEKE